MFYLFFLLDRRDTEQSKSLIFTMHLTIFFLLVFSSVFIISNLRFFDTYTYCILVLVGGFFIWLMEFLKAHGKNVST